ncbi:MAG: hypothetical protein AAF922_06495 [Pseudomonadota bacterium]
MRAEIAMVAVKGLRSKITTAVFTIAENYAVIAKTRSIGQMYFSTSDQETPQKRSCFQKRSFGSTHYMNDAKRSFGASGLTVFIALVKRAGA